MSYYKSLLSQILAGEQPYVSEAIEMFLEDNDYPVEKFEDFAINDAIQFLEENYKNYKNLIV